MAKVVWVFLFVALALLCDADAARRDRTLEPLRLRSESDPAGREQGRGPEDRRREPSGWEEEEDRRREPSESDPAGREERGVPEDRRREEEEDRRREQRRGPEDRRREEEEDRRREPSKSDPAGREQRRGPENRRREEEEDRRREPSDSGREEEEDRQALEPREPATEFSSEAGKAESWGSDFPALRRAGFEACRVTVNSGSLHLPVYFNSHALAFLIEGSGRIGLVTEPADSSGQRSEFRLNNGDAFAIPRGVAFWFYNDGHQNARLLIVAYSGRETHRFRKFQPLSDATGFSSRVLSHAWNVSEQSVRQLLDRQEKQERQEIIKVSDRESIEREQQSVLNLGTSDLVHRLGRDFPEVEVRQGGQIRELNSQKMLALATLRMSARHLRLEKRAIYAPTYSHNGDKVIYVIKGSANLEVVNDNGERVVAHKIEEGQLVFIPRGFPYVEVAEDEGYEAISVINTDRPMDSYFAGGNSIFNRIPRAIVSNAFGLNRDEVEKFLQRRDLDEVVIFPTPTQKQMSFERVVSLIRSINVLF